MSFHHFPSNLTEKLTGGSLCHFLELQGGYTANFETLGFKLKIP
jgi:hypothetical protein